MAAFDAVFVGAGINSLASAALLSQAGWRVCVLERNDYLGGCIKTSTDLTAPGFTHEVLASWHPLFTGSPAYAALHDELGRRGVEYLNTELPTGSAFPDGSSAFLTTSLEANVAELDRHAAGDGAAWERMFASFMQNADLSFGVLGTELWSPAGLGLGRQALRRFGRRGLLAYAATVLTSARDWLDDTFESDSAHGLLAPWVLHTGLGPDQATSGFMTQVIACALQLGGMPVPRGGGVKLVDALADIVRDAGGELRTEAIAERILVSSGRATAVRLADGETVRAERAVVASVTPTQLYGNLLRDAEVPTDVAAAAGRYRYGRGEMQIHFALSERPEWQGDERLARTAIVHVTPGLDGVSRAVNEADRGLLPAEATIVCGQPVAVDPSRAPDGSWILWIQLQELPAGRLKGDAAGELDVGDGSWSEELREAYADRIADRLGRHIRNLDRATIARVALSPADIAATNVNLVGGDIYGGSCALDQNFLFRPLPEAPGHRTPVDGLWHIGASTHPGPGLGAGSGYLVYQALTKPALPRRLLARVPVVGERLQQTVCKIHVKLALSEISTVNASFAEDVPAYAAAGFDGIGLWEMKLPEDDGANRAALRAVGLGVANCVPLVPSVLPLRLPGMEGPSDSDERVELLCASMRRFASYEPESVLCLTGPIGERDPGQARALVVAGLREVTAAAREAGVRLGLEPAHPAQHDTISFVNTVADAVALLEEAGLPDVGIMADTYNLWHERPEALADIADRVTGLHVADEPPDSTRTDRVLPGEGGTRSAELIRALADAGWSGYLDVEVFSTPERFWGLPVDEAARRAHVAIAGL